MNARYVIPESHDGALVLLALLGHLLVADFPCAAVPLSHPGHLMLPLVLGRVPNLRRFAGALRRWLLSGSREVTH